MITDIAVLSRRRSGDNLPSQQTDEDLGSYTLVPIRELHTWCNSYGFPILTGFEVLLIFRVCVESVLFCIEVRVAEMEGLSDRG